MAFTERRYVVKLVRLRKDGIAGNRGKGIPGDGRLFEISESREADCGTAAA